MSYAIPYHTMPCENIAPAVHADTFARNDGGQVAVVVREYPFNFCVLNDGEQVSLRVREYHFNLCCTERSA